MKIKIEQEGCFWHYTVDERHCTQKEYDYMFKYLDFDKLNKEWMIHFNNKVTKKWFKKTYMINNEYLYLNTTIYEKSPLGYKWLKDNWGKCLFWIFVYYNNKQELKTIINRIINIKLKD